MTWQIINVEPAYGICDQCKQHTCGIVDGKHKWIMTGIYDRSGDAIVIGYNCVELWANNLGISLKEVVKEVRTPPTREEVAEYVRNLLSTSAEGHEEYTDHKSHIEAHNEALEELKAKRNRKSKEMP